jgi:hypothetical protein
MSSQFHFNEAHSSSQPDLDLQYLTPAMHHDLLECIVKVSRTDFAKSLLSDEYLAFSLRCDGSVDRTQVDKIFVLCKAIKSNAQEELLYLGCAEPKERGAKGVFSVILSTLGSVELMEKFVLRISSVVTDGTNMNIGQKNGLWTLLAEFVRNVKLS